MWSESCGHPAVYRGAYITYYNSRKFGCFAKSGLKVKTCHPASFWLSFPALPTSKHPLAPYIEVIPALIRTHLKQVSTPGPADVTHGNVWMLEVTNHQPSTPRQENCNALVAAAFLLLHGDIGSAHAGLTPDSSPSSFGPYSRPASYPDRLTKN